MKFWIAKPMANCFSLTPFINIWFYKTVVHFSVGWGKWSITLSLDRKVTPTPYKSNTKKIRNSHKFLKAEARLKEAEDVIRFYSDDNNWFSSTTVDKG